MKKIVKTYKTYSNDSLQYSCMLQYNAVGCEFLVTIFCHLMLLQ